MKGALFRYTLKLQPVGTIFSFSTMQGVKLGKGLIIVFTYNLESPHVSYILLLFTLANTYLFPQPSQISPPGHSSSPFPGVNWADLWTACPPLSAGSHLQYGSGIIVDTVSVDYTVYYTLG